SGRRIKQEPSTLFWEIFPGWRPRLKGRTEVELFEQMRREYAHGVGTITGVAKKFGVHRRMVRDALASAIPADRKQPERESPKLDPLKGLIDAILMEDRKAPRKQRHAEHGQRWIVPLRLPACDATGVFGSARTGVRLFRRRVPAPAIRQSNERGEENPAWISARGDDSIRGVPVALGI